MESPCFPSVDGRIAGDRAEAGAKLVCVTDIPTPYRIHLFEGLNGMLRSRGADFEVLFMATTVSSRFWTVDLANVSFRHQIASGLHTEFKGRAFHFNSEILRSVVRDPPDWLLIGGGWHLPTAFSLVYAMSFLKKSITIMWSEANNRSMTVRTGPIARFRQAVLRQASAYAVPGRIAEETIRQICGSRARHFLPLPNLVDEVSYGRAVDGLRARRNELRRQRELAPDDLVLLWPARLHERTKGIMNFLDNVRPFCGKHTRILIAGEGPDRGVIEGWLNRLGMEGVRLLGQQPQREMLELFALADALLLPSLIDPNPLSVIEGLWAGLPLLISQRCGNWPEAVEPDRNGWVVDPESPSSMQQAFSALVRMSSADRVGYGRVSREIAEHRFASEPCIRRFVDSLMSLSAGLDGVDSRERIPTQRRGR
jgi:glycosyltransferase involved in cell wall biosynthesis